MVGQTHDLQSATGAFGHRSLAVYDRMKLIAYFDVVVIQQSLLELVETDENYVI